MASSPSLRPLQLRSLTPELLPQVLHLDQRCLGGLWSEAGYRREMESDQSELWVLTTPGTGARALPTVLAVACLWAILDEAHVTLLAVDLEYRRQGLGQYLLWALLGAARSRQLSWAALEVRVSNQLAIELYCKFGFQSIGLRRRYYQDTGEDAAILWLKGLQTEAFGQDHAQRGPAVYQRLARSGWERPSSKVSFCPPKYPSQKS